jgi:hypothetical protein
MEVAVAAGKALADDAGRCVHKYGHFIPR